MDLNYLYYRHQLSLMKADAAATPSVRAVHLGFARGYAARIAGKRSLWSSAPWHLPTLGLSA